MVVTWLVLLSLVGVVLVVGVIAGHRWLVRAVGLLTVVGGVGCGQWC